MMEWSTNIAIVAVVALFVLAIIWRCAKERGEKQVVALLALLPKNSSENSEYWMQSIYGNKY